MKKRMLSDLVPTIKAVLSLSLVDVVEECRPLLAALLLSHPDECVCIQQQNLDEPILDFVIKSVGDFRSNNDLMALYIDGGFFNEQLEILLKIAKESTIAGARLMPVFCWALTDSETLKLPIKLEDKIIHHIEWQRQHDGFAITELSFAKVNVVPADDVDTTGYQAS